MYALVLFVALRDRLLPAAATPVRAGEPPVPLDEATLSAWGAWAAEGHRAAGPATRSRLLPAGPSPARRPLGESAST